MFLRLFDSGIYVSCFNICVALSNIPYLPFTKRAALRCTISSLLELYFWRGCQTVALYSRKDLTREKYAVSLSFSGQPFRAAQFVSNNFRRKASVSEMLYNLGWQSLDGRRQDQRLVRFYKIINRLASVETEDILTTADSRIRKNHSFKFKHLQANCDSYRFSFFPATISS